MVVVRGGMGRSSRYRAQAAMGAAMALALAMRGGAAYADASIPLVATSLATLSVGDRSAPVLSVSLTDTAPVTDQAPLTVALPAGSEGLRIDLPVGPGSSAAVDGTVGGVIADLAPVAGTAAPSSSGGDGDRPPVAWNLVPIVLDTADDLVPPGVPAAADDPAAAGVVAGPGGGAAAGSLMPVLGRL